MTSICCVLVRVGNAILLLERSATDSSYPLYWNLPGGHAEKGESPRQAAARELGEEAGIWVDPKCLVFYAMQAETLNRMVYYYTLDLITSPMIVLNREHSRFTWYSDQTRTYLRLVPSLNSMLS